MEKSTKTLLIKKRKNYYLDDNDSGNISNTNVITKNHLSNKNKNADKEESESGSDDDNENIKKYKSKKKVASDDEI